MAAASQVLIVPLLQPCCKMSCSALWPMQPHWRANAKGQAQELHTNLFLKEDSDAKGFLPISCTKEKISKQVKWSVGSQGYRALLQLSESDSRH